MIMEKCKIYWFVAAFTWGCLSNGLYIEMEMISVKVPEFVAVIMIQEVVFMQMGTNDKIQSMAKLVF